MITVTTNLDSVKSYVTDLQNNQIPYATAKALTALANEARGDVVAGLPTKFTLRTSWWKPGGRYGFNVATAQKRDWPRQQAEIYTRAPWMRMQETGGTKLPKGQHIALPTSNVRRSKRDLITTANKPLALKNTVKVKTKGGDEVLLQRTSRIARIMYLLKPKAEIPARLSFFKTIQVSINRNWFATFSREYDNALRTAK